MTKNDAMKRINDRLGKPTLTDKNTHYAEVVTYGADEGSAQTVNGPITFHDGYWAMNGASALSNVHKTTNAFTVTNMSTTTPVAGVGPRGTL